MRIVFSFAVSVLAVGMIVQMTNYKVKSAPAVHEVSSTKIAATNTPKVTPLPTPLKLKKQAVINAIDQKLEGKLKGQGKVFYQAYEKHNVSAMLMGAIAVHETGNGSSDLIRNANNISGMNWVPGEKRPKYKSWYVKYGSIQEAIMDMGSRLKQFYLDEGRGSIDKIARKWAPLSDPRNGLHGMDNSSWGPAVEKHYLEMYNKAKEWSK